MTDEHEEHYAVTDSGRVIHVVVGDLPTSTAIIGRTAVCGVRVARLVHPSDHYDAGTVCRRCSR